MDLKEFYFNNIQEEEYHYRFYDSINVFVNKKVLQKGSKKVSTFNTQ